MDYHHLQNKALALGCTLWLCQQFAIDRNSGICQLIMVIFHSYVSLPEGTSLLDKPMYIYRIYIGYLHVEYLKISYTFERELGAIG